MTPPISVPSVATRSSRTRRDRREFLRTSAALAAGLFVADRPSAAADRSAASKLNVAFVGVGGRGGANLSGIAKHANVVALCDVDALRLGKAGEAHPGAKRYSDFRKLLEQRDVEAVAISIPDHNHAVVAVPAMLLGKHVYCEKPLAHSLFEVRAMRETAKRMKVVTQMGNQLHATDRLRDVAGAIRSGVLGPVREVVCWSDKVFSGGPKPTATPPVPAHLDWDLWLGPAKPQSYQPAYVPFYWRGWWDFGEGNFGDMACHIVDAPFWGLDLGYPVRARVEGPAPDAESAPDRLVAHLDFPARGERPPVKLTWYDGAFAPPKDRFPGIANLPGQGSLTIGERGTLLLPHASGQILLIRDGEARPFVPADPVLPRAEGQDHHLEWVRACTTGGKTTSDFEYGGTMTEAVLAGLVAYRTGKTLDWNGETQTAAGCPEAAALVRPEFRKGWPLPS